MKKINLKNRTINASIVCIVFLLLIIFYHHIDKYTTGLFFISLTLLVPITFVTIVVYLFKGLILVFRNIKELTFKIYFPVIISLVTLGYLFFSPYRLDSENLESEVVLRACFEGTQNQAYILFRDDNTFEIHWTGAFFANSWFYGNYTQSADSIYLDYKTEKPYRFGDSIINTGQNLITINKVKIDSNQYFVQFYLGYCKGLN